MAEKQYVIKRAHPTIPGVMEWRTYQVEGHTYVDMHKYDTREEAEAAAKEWCDTAVVVEINKLP